MTILVEGFDPDAIDLARRLAGKGERVRLASPAAELAEIDLLREAGIEVEPGADLDADPGRAEIAYLDVWTPEVAPRVQRLRAQGTRVSCLADLLFERWKGPTTGITGTAGKSTATALTATLLRAAGIDPAVSSGARAGNLWPTPDLLDRAATEFETPLVLELTSSHLAFMSTSPTLAAVTCFWPDHIELHGSLAAYRRAKETIVRHQRPTDTLVIDDTDPAVASFAALAPARTIAFSRAGGCPPTRGVVVRDGSIVVRWNDTETEIAELAGLPYPPAHLTSVLTAIAVGLAMGASPEALTCSLADVGKKQQRLPFRAVEVATIGSVSVIDDGLAATPAKLRATLASYPARSVVLIAGGEAEPATGAVHAAPAEQPLYESACDEIARAAFRVAVFGSAASRLESALSARGVSYDTVATFDEAVSRAAAAVAAHADAAHRRPSVLLFSPMFPVDQADRERFAELARAAKHAATQHRQPRPAASS